VNIPGGEQGERYGYRYPGVTFTGPPEKTKGERSRNSKKRYRKQDRNFNNQKRSPIEQDFLLYNL